VAAGQRGGIVVAHGWGSIFLIVAAELGHNGVQDTAFGAAPTGDRVRVGEQPGGGVAGECVGVGDIADRDGGGKGERAVSGVDAVRVPGGREHGVGVGGCAMWGDRFSGVVAPVSVWIKLIVFYMDAI
jgi:hypothetical protein